jgi:hypothetical protein
MTGVARLGDAVDVWGNGVLGPPWTLGALGESGGARGGGGGVD